MTEAQEKAVKQLKQTIWAHDAHSDKFEFKRWEVEESDKTVWVTSEVGMMGDDGTCAAIYCRVYRHVGIGPNGGFFAARPFKKGGIRRTWEKGLMNVIFNCKNS